MKKLLLALALLSTAVQAAPVPKTPVTDWLLAHNCTRSLWNVSIQPYVIGHGIFHYELPITQTYLQERYGESGRVNGSASGGEWCNGQWTVGDNSTVGCWTAYVGMPVGHVATLEDQMDMGYVDCAGTTACNYIRTNLGAGAACAGPPPVKPDYCAKPGYTCQPPCPPPPVCPTCPTLAAVPQDVRDTINTAPNWTTIGPGRKSQLQRVKAWLALVESYKPRVPSTGASALTH